MSRIRDQIAAKRAEAQNSPARRVQNIPAASSAAAARGFGSGSTEVLEDRTVSSQVKKAARSGRLDISGLDLHRIPPEAFSVLVGISPSNLERPPTPEPVDDQVRRLGHSFDDLHTTDRKAIFGKDTRKDEPWVECAELVGFKAGENRIQRLDIEIGAFGGLKGIELGRNKLTCLPDSFADLLRLTSIDLSHNELTAFPPQLLLLPAVINLDLSNNKITSLGFDSPTEPSDEGLSYGAGFLSTSFSRNQKKTSALLPALGSLNLGYNLLTNDPLAALGRLKTLRSLNLEANGLSGTLDVDAIGIGKLSLSSLSSLNLSGNPGLKGTNGNLEGVEVNLEGCGHGLAPAKANEEAVIPGDAQPTREKKPPLPVPEPTLTMVYKMCPAATFESLPLDIDFDLYLPSAPAGPSGHPLVIWFHGGGLLQGNKENLPPHFRRLPERAYATGGRSEHVAVISPNYRLAPQVPILDIFSDVTALLDFIRTKLNDRLKKQGKGEHVIDPERICLSGGSAGGYLALMGGMQVPPRASDESVGGYRGEKGVKCIAPFYPITDLEDAFWSTKTNPVPWWGKTVPDEAARPHLDLKAPPVHTAKSGGPRSILYMYMLQHALFPSLLFMRQKSVGQGLDGFRPDAHSLSVTTRIELSKAVKQVPLYFVYGTIDDKVQPMDRTLGLLKEYQGDVEVWRVEGGDHQFDEDPGEECEGFREWLGKALL